PAPAVFFGWIGVYFFFAISGYCIFLTLERSATVRVFLARRFSRIYPAFLAAAVLLFLYGLVAYIPTVADAGYRVKVPNVVGLVFNLFFFGEWKGWVNGSFWSVAAEVKFYLLIGALAFLIPDHRRLAKTFTIVALAAAPVWMLAQAFDIARSGSFIIPKIIASATVAPYLPFFALGILGRMQIKGEALSPWLIVAALAEAGLVVFLTAADGETAALARSLAIVAAFLFLMALFLRFASARPLPHIPYVSQALAGIGFLSYSWYLLHENLGISFLFTLNRYLPNAAAVVLAAAGTLVIAYVFAQAVEWRFRKPFERFALLVLDTLHTGFSRLFRGRPATSGVRAAE
ncbi:MAG TPA: acyltransferase, partial [Devosiaceae bacterium]